MSGLTDAQARMDRAGGEPADGYITPDDMKGAFADLWHGLQPTAGAGLQYSDLVHAAPVPFDPASGYNAGAVVSWGGTWWVAKRDTTAGQDPGSNPGAWISLDLDDLARKVVHADQLAADAAHIFAADVTITPGTPVTVTHNLGSTDVLVQARNGTREIDLDVQVGGVNTVQVDGRIAGVRRIIITG
jgi:hypothetical protein